MPKYRRPPNPKHRRQHRLNRKKRGYANGGKVAFTRNTLVPDRLVCRLSYNDNIPLVKNTLSYQYWNCRLNSIYDPDYAIIAGHQPLGYDQWASFYQNYRVYKAKVVCEFSNMGLTPVQVGFLPYSSTQGQLTGVDDDTFEQPHVVKKTISNVDGQNRCTLVKMVDVPRILGMSHLQYKASTLSQTNFGNNPVTPYLCNGAAFARTIDPNQTSINVALAVKIIFYVELMNRKVVAISAPEGKDPNGHWTGIDASRPALPVAA